MTAVAPIPFLAHPGTCPVCEQAVMFTAATPNLRDSFICPVCQSIPRERALMAVLAERYPQWRTLKVHEFSPSARGTSSRLQRECPGYSFSYFWPDVPRGAPHPQFGARCEDIERLTFAADSFDIIVSQDVFEHVFAPDKAAHEIARVLRPGGAHVFTVPLVNKDKPSVRRASMDAEGAVIHHLPAEYHGNPSDPNGSLVTMHWGYDIADFITSAAGTPTEVLHLDDVSRGLRAPLLDVVISTKPRRRALMG